MKAMATYNSEIKARRKQRLINIAATILVPTAVFFIASIDYWVNLLLSAFGL